MLLCSALYLCVNNQRMTSVQNFSNVITLAKEDDDFIMTFVSKGTEDLEHFLLNVKEASASANLPLLLFTQHKSKTLLTLLGDTSVADLISSIVEKARSQDWEHTPELLKLEIEVRGLIYKVNTELTSKQTF